MLRSFQNPTGFILDLVGTKGCSSKSRLFRLVLYNPKPNTSSVSSWLRLPHHSTLASSHEWIGTITSGTYALYHWRAIVLLCDQKRQAARRHMAGWSRQASYSGVYLAVLFFPTRVEHFRFHHARHRRPIPCHLYLSQTPKSWRVSWNKSSTPFPSNPFKTLTKCQLKCCRS